MIDFNNIYDSYTKLKTPDDFSINSSVVSLLLMLFSYK